MTPGADSQHFARVRRGFKIRDSRGNILAVGGQLVPREVYDRNPDACIAAAGFLSEEDVQAARDDEAAIREREAHEAADRVRAKAGATPPPARSNPPAQTPAPQAPAPGAEPGETV